MPKYSVKIGEIMLESDAPITDEQREAAIKMLRHEKPMDRVYARGLEVKLAVDRH